MKKSKFVKYCINILSTVLIVFLSFLLIAKIIFVEVVVSGPSMNPVLTDLEYGYTDRLIYKFTGLDRYDIVVVKTRDDSLFIKRVIGLPNETIQIIDGRVYINDELLTDDTYCKDLINNAGLASNKITLADDEYFVMGDNRNNSLDSRNEYLGVVKYSQIYGHSFISRGFCNDKTCDSIYGKHDYIVKGW